MFICQMCGTDFQREGTRGSAPTFCRQCRLQRRRDRTNAWHRANPEEVLRHKKRQLPVTVLMCVDCGVTFPRVGHFGPLRTRCAPCKVLHRRHRDSAIVRRRRMAKYGITDDQYAALMTRQNGVCAICKSDSWGALGPNIDHCHVTGMVRGLLCAPCNQAIGHLRDDPQLLVAAARYLRAAHRRASVDLS